jgi:hypothetical protein
MRHSPRQTDENGVDSETPEALAFKLQGRAELLLELSATLPSLSSDGALDVRLSEWLWEQLQDIETETSLLSAIIDDPSREAFE